VVLRSTRNALVAMCSSSPTIFIALSSLLCESVGVRG
jgi:hypothetical protein